MKLAQTRTPVRRLAFALLAALSGCQQAPRQIGPAPAVFQAVPAPPVLAVAPANAERRILVTVQFGLNDYSILPEAYPLLNNLVAALKDERLRGVSYEINGHTDLSGKFAHNVALSAKRAKSVSNYLRNGGVQIPPIRAQGFGPLQLLYPTEPFRPGNRRVEIIAIGP
jgi:outer membrane protein OmpA-like peptidoglycan-associated protein